MEHKNKNKIAAIMILLAIPLMFLVAEMARELITAEEKKEVPPNSIVLRRQENDDGVEQISEDAVFNEEKLNDLYDSKNHLQRAEDFLYQAQTILIYQGIFEDFGENTDIKPEKYQYYMSLIKDAQTQKIIFSQEELDKMKVYILSEREEIDINSLRLGDVIRVQKTIDFLSSGAAWNIDVFVLDKKN